MGSDQPFLEQHLLCLRHANKVARCRVLVLEPGFRDAVHQMMTDGAASPERWQDCQ